MNILKFLASKICGYMIYFHFFFSLKVFHFLKLKSVKIVNFKNHVTKLLSVMFILFVLFFFLSFSDKIVANYFDKKFRDHFYFLL